MLHIGLWKVRPNGFYSMQSGDIRLLVEKVGAGFRVLVTRAIDEMQSEEIVYTGSAASAADAMTTATRIAERTSARIAA